MINEKINNSHLIYDPNHGEHSREYYIYCIGLIKNFLFISHKQYNIIFGCGDVYDYKHIRMDIQLEHTLVKHGGRSVDNVIYGNAKHDDGNYLVRIDRYNYLNSLDFVIEYSLSNYYNILQSEKFNDFIKKVIYIPPLIYDINFNKELKNDIISMYSLINNNRRCFIHNELCSLNINYRNINNVFCKNDILNLFRKTKILVNVHQTDHHHTFEELRILPALLNGVIIVSEKSALTEYIPYNEYIIWCDFDEIKNKVEEVNNNYDYYYNKIFINGKLKTILEEMQIYNLHAFDKYL